MTKLNTNTSEEKAHSEFGGSQAERIMNCPASVRLARGLPKSPSSAPAEYGTAAHACLEFFVLNRKKLKNPKTRKVVMKAAEKGKTFIEESGNTVEWTQEMIDDALDTLAWIEDQLQPGSEVLCEVKIESTKFTTGSKKMRQKSTLDICIINWAAREVIIADYKYGVHPVEVKKNSQIIYYALGLLLKIKAWNRIDRIRCVIMQPRAKHKDGNIREWYISVDDAIKWGRKFRKTVKVALKPNAPFKIGNKWCFFCPAKKVCPEMKAKLAARDFDDLD